MSIVKQLIKEINKRDSIVSQKIEEVYNICKELNLEDFYLSLEDEIHGYDETDSIPEFRKITPCKTFKITYPRKRNSYGYSPKNVIHIPNDETNPYLHIIRYEENIDVSPRIHSEKGYFMFYASIKNLEAFLADIVPEKEQTELEEFMQIQVEQFLDISKNMLIRLLKGLEEMGVLGENGIFTQQEKEIINNLFDD